MRIIHLITDLNQGGAEIVLLRLLPELAAKGCEQQVICLRELGIIGEAITKEGFHVQYLNMKPSVPSLSAIAKIKATAQAFKPDLMQSWMYHADYYSCLVHPLLPRLPLIWGLHNTTLSKDSNLITRGISRRLAHYSDSVPQAVIACSREAIRVHKEFGYDAKKMWFVPNGFDTQQFAPDASARARLRQELGVSADQKLIGCIARFDQQKNHKGLIECWKLLAQDDPTLHFLLAGKSLDSENLTLNEWLLQAGLRDRCFLLGMRSDVPQLLNALDLFVLSSNSGEAFPLIVGEAMACGTLCSITDIGDSAFLLGENGRVSPINDPQTQAIACRELLNAPADQQESLRTGARERILNKFSLQTMADGYYTVYQKVLNNIMKAKG